MRLKTWRKRQGFSQTKLAEFLGVTRRTVIRYERGHSVPVAARLRQVEDKTEGAVKPADWYR